MNLDFLKASLPKIEDCLAYFVCKRCLFSLIGLLMYRYNTLHHLAFQQLLMLRASFINMYHASRGREWVNNRINNGYQQVSFAMSYLCEIKMIYMVVCDTNNVCN